MPKRDQLKNKPNILINCACGCGDKLFKYDKYGRTRYNLPGHANRNKAKILFFDKVEKTNSCWIWKGGKTTRGYGSLRINKEHIYAHRYIYEITYGKILEGMEVLHKCDNPACVNPKHLRVATHADNMRDAIVKGRMKRNEKGQFYANLHI